MKTLLNHPQKLVSLQEARDIRCAQRFGEVVLTTGSYQIAHGEHLRYLATARSLGSMLFVAVDSDQYILKRKGSDHLYVPFEARVLLLAWLPFVDYIIKHEGDDVGLVNAIAPDIYVQSRATKEETLEQKQPVFEEVRRGGGKVVVFDADNRLGISSSGIANKLRK